MDALQSGQDLVRSQEVEFEALFELAARRGRWRGVQIEAGLAIEPGFRKAHGHDEDPRLASQAHVVGQRLAPGPDGLQGRGRRAHVQLQVPPAAVFLVIERLGERLLAEGPGQFVGDGLGHVAMQHQVGVDRGARLGRQAEAAIGDVVALDQQLLFDVAREARADGEHRVRGSEAEGGRQHRAGHRPQAGHLSGQPSGPARVLGCGAPEGVSG